ncbi:hypothetical protein FHT78_004011 [Rhizobium sp. BK196]|uniref:hypothetical protein n=1 Tax=Rhizobium sp. BK196 TaxID=2587073 RepID=UPI001616DAFD|nr:hypothetical protein [Rhizobium sp. BK196]MBB3312229.1 hypothetical protein [Rhizobium sp. BK196]
MNIEKKHKYFDVSIGDWIKKIPNDLEFDAISLKDIANVGRFDFELPNADSEEFVRLGVLELIKAGASPVVRGSEAEFWVKCNHLGNNAEEIASNIVKNWKKSGVDPDEEGLWFAQVD